MLGRLDDWSRDLAAVVAERDRLAEQVKRSEQVEVIRPAIADPGQFVKRRREHRDGEWIYESVPAWAARAVVLALRGEAAKS